MRFNLLDRPLLARVVIDVAPDYSRHVYISKYEAGRPEDVAKIVEAVIWGAVDLAARHGITIKGFQVDRKEAP